MELPPLIRAAVEDAVGAVRSARPVGGGDVSHAARIETASGPVFAKWGRGAAGQTYPSEADGLKALAAVADGLWVPQPLALVADGNLGGLVLPWVETASLSADGWQRFGGALAALHRADAGTRYGADADNWVGSKPQRGGWSESWPTFFGDRRLAVQAEVVRERGAWDSAWDGMLSRLVARLPEILPESPTPSVVHGDLWSGNALGGADGRGVLIDPAVYVGHREVDLAMTELFGGFPATFYDGYRRAWPVESGYPERREVYNLFHLINHLTHGPGYRRPVEATLQRFGA